MVAVDRDKGGGLRMNKVIRKCNGCYQRSENGFKYLGDGVFACSICGCKYTCIADVVEEGGGVDDQNKGKCIMSETRSRVETVQRYGEIEDAGLPE